MSWRHQAACVGHDPELFFPFSDTGPAALQLAAAQDVCSSCPVRLDCLEWAVRHGIAYGVWGGLGETARRGLHRSSPRRGALPAESGLA